MKILSFVFLSSLILAACSGNLLSPEITTANLELQLAEIKEFAEKGSCSENAQCSYLPYGSKPCGGPRGFIIFSSEVDAEALKAKVEKYTKAEAAYNKQHNVISDCMLETPPQNIGCINGNCKEME